MPVLTENWRMRPKHNWYSKLLRKYYNFRVNLTKLKEPICNSDILEKVKSEKRLIIQVPFGGLGDHLIYSSLPELLWEQKGIKTLISNKSIFRSKAICDFIWGLNPYITFTDEKGWFTHKPLKNSYPTIDEYFQKLFKLKGDGCPKIYYKPILIGQLKGKTIVDPSCGPAGKANGYFEPDFYKRFVEYLKNNVGSFVVITHQHPGSKNELQKIIKSEFNPEIYNVNTIEKLSDVLYSADRRYVLHSGAASLSAALRLETYVLNYLKPSTYDSFKYPLNKHIHLI